MKPEIKTRSVIQTDGTLKIWRQLNLSSYENTCICSASNNPPCSFCTGTCECDTCGHIFDNSDITETAIGYQCEDCINQDNYEKEEEPD